jgi:hypothetical protein
MVGLNHVILMLKLQRQRYLVCNRFNFKKFCFHSTGFLINPRIYETRYFLKENEIKDYDRKERETTSPLILRSGKFIIQHVTVVFHNPLDQGHLFCNNYRFARHSSF